MQQRRSSSATAHQCCRALDPLEQEPIEQHSGPKPLCAHREGVLSLACSLPRRLMRYDEGARAAGASGGRWAVVDDRRARLGGRKVRCRSTTDSQAY